TCALPIFKSVCFGSKKLAKARTSTQKYLTDPTLWEQNWRLSRYGKMTISGRKDAKTGNFVFTYSPDSKSLSFKAINGNVVNFDNVVFPYGQENVENAIHTQTNLKNKKDFGKPISWSIEDRGDYYIIKCLVDVPANPYINHSKDSGVIGVDLNVDHFAVSIINKIGQLIESFSMNFDIHNKTTGQLNKIIEAKAIGLVNYAVNHKKPIVLEKLDTTKSKVKNPYGNKKANRLMSQFAYNKMITAIKSRADKMAVDAYDLNPAYTIQLDTIKYMCRFEITYNKMITAIKSRADKMGVEVYEVNPAYTSQIGKIKYMRRFGISIHEAASYVIARRAMGFKEILPPALHSLVPEQKQGLHHWAHWVYISNSLSNIRKNTFYQIELSNLNRLCSWNALF